MKRFIGYDKIYQFKNAVREVKYFYSRKKNGSDFTVTSLPTISVSATEKIHGTNGAVCYNYNSGMWVQSRSRIIAPGDDNSGCAAGVLKNKDVWGDLISELALLYNIDLKSYTISLFFEWAGGNIQKTSACSGTEKAAYIFEHFKVSPIIAEEDENGEEIITEDTKWLPVLDTLPPSTGANTQEEFLARYNNAGVYFVAQFEVYSLDINFNQPALSINQLNAIVEKIEANSPIGSARGVDNNTGEGIVVSFTLPDNTLIKFKVKGDKHTTSNVKKLAPVDDAYEQKKIDLATAVCTPSRLEQGVKEVCGPNELTRDQIGDIIRWVINDILDEEADTLAESGFEPKVINPLISKTVAKYLLDILYDPQ